MKMNEVSNIPIDPWLNKLKEKDLDLYKEFIRGAANFSGMSKALFIYCKEDLGSDNLMDIFKNNSDAQIIKEVLTHEKCPKDLIQDIINGKLNKLILSNYSGIQSPSVMLEFVAKRTDLSLEVIKKLIDKSSKELRQVLAENNNLDEELIEILSKDSEYSVRREIAQRRDLDSKIIENLINDKEDIVRSGIAQIQNLTENQILKLIKDKDPDVRSYLALNQNVSINSLIPLAKDRNIDVLKNLCERKNLNEKILEVIINSVKLKINKIDVDDESQDSDLEELLKIIQIVIKNNNITSANLKTISRFLLEKEVFSKDFNWIDLQIHKNNLLNEFLIHHKLPDEVKVEFSLLGHKSDNSDLIDVADNKVLDAEFKEDYSKLSSQIFRFGLEPDQKEEVKAYVSKFAQIFTDLGQPIGLLHPLTNFNPEQKYDIGQTFSEWVSHEIIHRTLWPEISKRNDAKFWMTKDSYNGDLTYFTVTGIDSIVTFYDIGDMRIDVLDYPYIHEWGGYRDWISDSEEIEYGDAIDVIDFDNYLDIRGLDFEDDVINEETYDYFLANAIKEISNEVEITPLGKDFIIGTALESGAFEERSTTLAEIDLENCHVYGWSKIKLDKQEFITRLIIEGLQSSNEILQKFSDYFLVSIALIPDLNPKIKNILDELNNDSINKALTLSSK